MAVRFVSVDHAPQCCYRPICGTGCLLTKGAGKGYPGLTAWTDELGQRMDDYYYVMTRQYMKIYLTGNVSVGTALKEENSPAVYRATPSGFVHQTIMPSQAPLLVVPDGLPRIHSPPSPSTSSWSKAPGNPLRLVS